MPKKKSGNRRRQYSDELKAEAVQMLLDGHSANSVASRLGLSGAHILYHNTSHPDKVDRTRQNCSKTER